MTGLLHLKDYISDCLRPSRLAPHHVMLQSITSFKLIVGDRRICNILSIVTFFSQLHFFLINI